MQITRILGFTDDEIKTLTAAGKILGEVARAYHEETSDTVILSDEAEDLINALKDVLSRLSTYEAVGK